MKKIAFSMFVISVVTWNFALLMLVGEIGVGWILVDIWLSTVIMLGTVGVIVHLDQASKNGAKNLQQSHARQFKEPTVDVNNATKIGLYFIKKAIADRLKAGEHLPHHEIILWGYGDLGPGDNRQRVRENDPESLIACDLLLGETS